MILVADGETMGQRVARCRRARGMSQEVLAHLLGRSHSWLTKVERGERQLDRMSLILEIAQILKVDATEITGQADRPGFGLLRPRGPAERDLSLFDRGGPGFGPVPLPVSTMPSQRRQASARMLRSLSCACAARPPPTWPSCGPR